MHCDLTYVVKESYPFVINHNYQGNSNERYFLKLFLVKNPAVCRR